MSAFCRCGHSRRRHVWTRDAEGLRIGACSICECTEYFPQPEKETRMGLMQRRKGRSFEQRIASELRQLWPGSDVHRASQAERAREPDVVIRHGPLLAKLLWLELQDARVPKPLEKLEQAEHDAPSHRRCVVVWHKLGARSRQATMRHSTLVWLVDGLDQAVNSPLDGIPVTLDWDDFMFILGPWNAEEETT